jgi:putative membrane protein
LGSDQLTLGSPAEDEGKDPPDLDHEPDYRFSLANERTFLAWIRTALALLAGGVAVHQLVPSVHLPGGRLALALACIVLSVCLSAMSFNRWRRNEWAMRRDLPLPSSRMPLVLAVGLSIVTVISLIIVIAGGDSN